MAKTKRQPTPPSGGGSKGGLSSSNQSKDANQTVFNSQQDNQLATVDAYGESLQSTVNRLYKFSNTINLDNIFSSLSGGLGMAKKLGEYLKDANEIKTTLQKGNIIDALGKISPYAKSSLQSAGIPPDYFDKIVAAANISINLGGVIKNVKDGNVDILQGLSEAAKALTGDEFAFIKDVQKYVTLASGIVDEFSSVGISIGEEWNKLTNIKDRDNTNISISTEVAINTANDLARYGDYKTLVHAIKGSDPKRIEMLTGEIMSSLFESFSLDTAHNRGKDHKDIFNDVIEVLKALRGADYLWVPRDKNREAINANLFIRCSADWKQVIRTVMGSRFYLAADTGNNVSFDYASTENEVFMAFALMSLGTGSFEDEFSKDFPGFNVNETMLVRPLVEPSVFVKNNILI